jgi:hypothetical protein
MTTPTTPTTPKTPTPSTPTPTQHENDQFRLAVSNGTLPHDYAFAPDGSPVHPEAIDPTQPPPTWP